MPSAGGTLHELRTRDPVLDLLWRRRVLLLVGVAVLVGIVVAYRNRPVVLYDDAAITMRYARRIAEGDGWTYNDSDRTNGASAPLYTMILAAFELLGINVITAARLVCSVALAASFGLVAYLSSRIAGFVAGVLGTIFIVSWVEFQTQGLFGMESALAAALGLAVLVALREDRDTLAGVLLGLAVLNKLDAGFLAVAVAGAYLLVLRRPPWRVAWVSAVVVAPWLLFSTVYFGSPLPHSFTQKASDQVANPTWVFDRTWIFDAIQRQGMMLLVVLGLAALAAVPMLIRTKPRAAVALVGCVAWPVLHGLAFSLIDLGDAYSWYLTVLYPPTAVAAACALGFLFKAVAASSRVLALAVTAAIVVVAIGLPDGRTGSFGRVADAVLNGHEQSDYEAFENVRREAGKALGELAEPGDVVETCYGWIAFEAFEHPIAETCPLNTSEPVGPPRWGVLTTYPGTDAPAVPENATVVDSFVSELGQGGRIDVVEYTDPEG